MDESKKSNSSNDEVSVTDLIEITIKTIDSKNFQFQVENDVSIISLYLLCQSFVLVHDLSHFIYVLTYLDTTQNI